MIQLRKVGVRFGSRFVLSGVDLEVDAGERVAIVGPSGAGKTTLLRLLNATLQPTAGEVRVLGEDLANCNATTRRAMRAQVGFVHQDFSLVPNIRVWRNVIAGKLGQRGLLASLRSFLIPQRSDLERAHELLERVGVEEKLFQRTDTLSGGQRQRLALVRALFQDPRILLADEPVASVDPARAREMLGLMDHLAQEEGLTLVMSLHDLELAREFFPRLVGLREGEIAFDGPTGEIEAEQFEELYRLKRGAGV